MDVVSLLTRTLREHFVLLLVGVALAWTGVVSIRALFFTSAHEIVYDGRLSMSYCTRASVCFARYELAIGNTGSETQAAITARVPIDTSKWSASHTISNIAADQRRANDPDVNLATSNTAYVYTLNRFAAGTEFLLTLECRLCTVEDLERAKSTRAEVQASGSVLPGNPRVTTLSRRLSRIF